jgi:hypothetical protein
VQKAFIHPKHEIWFTMKNRTLAILALILAICSVISVIAYSQHNFSISDAFTTWEICNKTPGATRMLMWQLLPITSIVVVSSVSLLLGVVVLFRSKKLHREGELIAIIAIIIAFALLLLCINGLEPQYLGPDRCTMQQGFYCREHKIIGWPKNSIDTIKFTFQNGRGTTMMIERVSAQGVGEINSTACDTGSLIGLSIENGASFDIDVPCGLNTLDGVSAEKIKFDLEVIWYDPTRGPEYNNSIRGQILEKVIRCS